MNEIERREPGDDEEGVHVSPADRLISNLEGTFYKLTEAAKILGVSSATLRRMMKNDEIKAPSYKVRQGGMYMYLYTPEDIAELRQFVSPSPERRLHTEGEYPAPDTTPIRPTVSDNPTPEKRNDDNPEGN